MTTNDTQDPLIDDQNSNSNDETNSSSSAVNSQQSDIVIPNGASISSTSESSTLDEDSTSSTDNTSESTENTIQPRDSQMPSAATIVFPTYNVSTTTTGASWATLNNATQSGYAIKYNGGANYGTDGNYQFYIGESAGTNAGNAIYDTQSRSFAITGNAGVHLGRGNIFIVGSTVAANLTIATPTTAAKKTSASLTLASGSYLSVNGYLGATTSTAVAGFVSAADQVSIKVVSSFFTVGPTTGTVINPQFGNNNVMEIGGTFGVYQNASANIGSSFSLSAGALEAGANNANIIINNGANIQLSGAGLLLNGSSTNIKFGDNLALSTTTMSFGSKAGGGVQTNATLSTGVSANIIVNNGVTNTLSNGIVQFGDDSDLHLLAGDLVVNGAGGGTGRSWFHMGANNTITLDNGALAMSGTSQSFDWGANGVLNANSVAVVGTDQVFYMGAGANVNVTGTLAFGGSASQMTFESGLTLNADTIVLRGVGTNTSTQAGNNLTIGDNANITVSNNFNNRLYNGTVKFGNSVTTHLLAGNFVIGGSGFNGSRNLVQMGDNNTLTLDAGSITMQTAGQTFDWGINGTIKANSLSIAGTNQVFSMGTGANVGLTGGIIVDATSAVLTFLDNTSMNLGSGGLTFNQSASFTLGNGGSFATTGDITFASAAGGTIFNVGNVTTFTAGNVIINAAKPTITLGTNINYAVTGWQLNAANNNVKLGAGATGNIGDITFGASATGSLFDTGVANNLVFGKATVINDGILTLNGTVTGTSLNLSNAATVNIPAGANVDVSSLVIDGSNGAQQVVINVADGATLNVGSLSTLNVASSNMPKIVINGTGNVVIGGQVARASDTLAHEVQFAGANGIYHYEGNIQDLSGKLTITDFALTDQAIFEVSAAYADQSRYVTSVVDGVLYINYVDAATGALTEVAHFDYTPATTGQDVPNVLIVKNTASSTGYDIIITKCFLTGTHILTPEGEVTVENLKAGDSVITLQNGQQVSKQVVWAGNMDVNVNNYEHKDALYPVRIKAHAFGLNQPCRDLLVTPEHTIYVDGGLVPARMLVNGRSIITDTSMDSFTVYHIETEEHSILLSENLTTESYLNTDDRHQFNGSAINLHLTFNENAGHQSWESDAAAPLTVARHQVEPIWQILDRRATQQGYAPVSKPEVTNDPSLCLITQKGERLQPVDVKGNTYSFYVPANVRVVAMHSKAALPSEVVGPYLDDRRMLGVLVAKISVFGDRNLNILPADMTGLSGWHPAELNRADRWTKGLATLPEAVAEISTKVKLIKVELTATSEYFVDMIEIAEKIA